MKSNLTSKSAHLAIEIIRKIAHKFILNHLLLIQITKTKKIRIAII